MRLRWVSVLSTFALVGSFARSATAEVAFESKLHAYDAEILAEIEAQNADAATAFREANAAADAHDYAAAKAGYQRAAELDPMSPHPLRRLCGVEAELGERLDAVDHCNQAIALQRDAANLSALAMVLLGSDTKKALSTAKEAAQTWPGDEFAALAWVEAAVANEDAAALSTSVRHLQSIAPGDGVTWFYTAIMDLQLGEPSEAKEALVNARAAGVPAARTEKLDAAVAEAEERSGLGAWRYALIGGAVWLGVLLLLLAAGFALGGAVDRSIARLPLSPTGHATGVEGLVKRAYAATLVLACLFFYVSVPLLVLALTGLIVAFGYACLIAGVIPVKIGLLLMFVFVATLGSIARAFSARASNDDPGPKLDLGANPQLRAVLDEVAGRIETRPVDTVFLTPGTGIAVFEKGSVMSSVRGAKGERCLVLGLGSLYGMRLLDFKAILAHEYGHFRNEDTAGGTLTMAVERRTRALTAAMIQSGAARAYNPAWLMMTAFFLTFSRLSRSSSRLREVLADRWSAFAYGSRAFERGLRHVVRRQVVFTAQADRLLASRKQDDEPLHNFYRELVPVTELDTELADLFADALSRRASVHDSHPPPEARIAHVRMLDASPEVDAADRKRDALSLFDDLQTIELEMTHVIRGRLAKAGGLPMPRSDEPERRVRPKRKRRATRKSAPVDDAGIES